MLIDFSLFLIILFSPLAPVVPGEQAFFAKSGAPPTANQEKSEEKIYVLCEFPGTVETGG